MPLGEVGPFLRKMDNSKARSQRWEGVVLAPPSRGIWRYLEMFLVVTLGTGVGVGTGFRRQEPGMLLDTQAALLQSSPSPKPTAQAQHPAAGQPGSPPHWALKGGKGVCKAISPLTPFMAEHLAGVSGQLTALPPASISLP